MGDACGIGPEIAALLLARADPDAAGAFVVGDVGVMRRAAAWTAAASGAAESSGARLSTPVATIERPDDVRRVPFGTVPVLPVEGLPADLLEAPVGHVDARAGRAAGLAIERAVALALAGEVAAVVTAPIHKEAFAAAGIVHPGHTEMLQALAGGAPVRMMLANASLKTVLVTIHMALRDAIEAVTTERVLETIRIADAAARRWRPPGAPAPRVAVAGLNPHAGEGGLFGDEEIRVIAPAIAAARADGIDASGPHAPDTVFMRARDASDHPGEFDLVVAMTHDHGLIPVKYLGLAEGVNVTLGLPFVRTSPDHGTAFDLAGTGRADPSSLAAALRMARALSAGSPP